MNANISAYELNNVHYYNGKELASQNCKCKLMVCIQTCSWLNHDLIRRILIREEQEQPKILNSPMYPGIPTSIEEAIVFAYLAKPRVFDDTVNIYDLNWHNASNIHIQLMQHPIN